MPVAKKKPLTPEKKVDVITKEIAKLTKDQDKIKIALAKKKEQLKKGSPDTSGPKRNF